jgi:hypothetical protein
MAGVIQVNKDSEQVGKINRRINVSEFFFPSCRFPSLITDCVNDFGSFLSMSIMLNLITNLPAPVSVQEKEAFYRRL